MNIISTSRAALVLCPVLVTANACGLEQPPTAKNDGSATVPEVEVEGVGGDGVGQQKDNGKQITLFDGKRSYKYLKKICSYGNRMSGSAGMKQQQKLLEKHFVDLGAQVAYQEFQIQHPVSRRDVRMANMIIEWHPKSTERLLLCAHYDTRPLPDQDPNPHKRREGVFLGANDGASGVALLMELGHHVGQLPERYGLDFVFFDGEELVYVDPRDRYFLGSEWFARKYVNDPPDHQYRAGVLFDMVADAKLTMYQEEHSVMWEQTRPLVKEIWNTAQKMGVKEFIPRVRYLVRDDHLPLNKIAKIPVCDLIDFEYPDPRNRFWHTTADTPARCSADSLEKVGRVIQTWLKTKR
ncbi:MAG: M28 family peptidase [Pirellulales bacterium]|nr:M28 family peptidase [Pirellulales bacterium]